MKLDKRDHGYQQALSDFGITELLSHLSNYSDAHFNAAWMNLEEQELESLAAIFIQQLTANIKGKLIASYLNPIRHSNADGNDTWGILLKMGSHLRTDSTAMQM